MIYTQATQLLRRWTVKAVKPGLDRTQRLLAALGHPDAACPAIQITGTNGKGSVAALISLTLQTAGYRVGRFTSPHLEDERERIVIDGSMISKPVFAAIVSTLLPSLKKMHTQGQPATTFEAWTVLAALAFQQARVQVVVLEVGMGGRLDATSAWRNIIASVLTQVSLEHTRELGNTLAAIAGEKMAIARPGVPFFTAEPNPALRASIRRHCRMVGAPLFIAGLNKTDTVRLLEWERLKKGIQVELSLPKQRKWRRQVGLRGEHQALNAALAAMVIDGLVQNRKFLVSEKAWRQGFKTVNWPGRLECVAQHPTIFLDGAHNPAAARALVHEIMETTGAIELVMGVMADKDVDAMVRILKPGIKRVWTVKPPDKRGLPATELAAKFMNLGVPALARKSPGDALRAACQAAGPRGTVVVAGSLYLLAPARRYLKSRGIV
jgi:dihydrofolate synthase/folylpolyglutamate synthase